MASNEQVPKWKLALAVGIPVTAVSLAAIWYYRKRKVPKSKEIVSKAPVSNNVPPATVEQTPLEKAQEIKNRGNKYFKGQNYQKAVECYTEAISLCPPDNKQELATFYQNRAAAYEQLKDWDNVLADCNSALQFDNRYVKALSRRAKVYEQKEKFVESLEDITAVCILEQFQNQGSIATADRVLKALGSHKAKENIKNKPAISPSHQTIRQYYSSFAHDPVLQSSVESKEEPVTKGAGDTEGEGDKADDTVTNGENNEESTSKQSYYADAQKAFSEGRYEDIIELCSKEVNDDNSSHLAEALLLRATFYMLRGEADKAKEDFARLLDLANISKAIRSNALIKRGSMFMQNGNEEDSRKDFAEAIIEDPKNSDIFHHRGQLNLLTGNMEAAMQDFEQSVSLNPNFAIAQVQKKFAEYTLAKAVQDIVQMQTVLKEFRDILQKFNQSAEGYILYGQALSDMQNYDDADDQFRLALELEKDNGNIYVHRGLLMLQWKQDVDEALRLMRKAIQIDAGCEFAYQTLATLEVQCGNVENAIELFNKAIELAKTEVELTHLYSMLHAAQSQATVAKRFGVDLSALGAGPMFAQ